ncbi:hypothetical protein RFI_08900 [Reticulomyxa filosa]|uniref:Uncharacterized protein n=1 Tax=Reticulomyxa filosa TaxID=46433 RepID=X6NR77_RETFI|nr:hypothetical protein RFI_08900 [Reticulomyxa filosa]|eukprot:ETO28234.1 hypothetical protein RFI_08900 [Reticulomyxa filosa]
MLKFQEENKKKRKKKHHNQVPHTEYSTKTIMSYKVINKTTFALFKSLLKPKKTKTKSKIKYLISKSERKMKHKNNNQKYINVSFSELLNINVYFDQTG